MSSEQPVGTPPLVTPSERLVGRVKWFNNKAGYGFITVSDGDRAGSDVFVHHSNVVVTSEQYKYLVQGEYVSFTIDCVPGGKHEFQAGEVSGINDGKLMCETRREFRENRVNYSKTASSSTEVKAPRSTRPPRADDAPRARGAGPRDGSEWTMVAEGKPKKQPVNSSDSAPAPRARGRPPRSAKPAP